MRPAVSSTTRVQKLAKKTIVPARQIPRIERPLSLHRQMTLMEKTELYKQGLRCSKTVFPYCSGHLALFASRQVLSYTMVKEVSCDGMKGHGDEGYHGGAT